MASPMPPLLDLQSPPPGAIPFRGEATLANGLRCEYFIADTEKVAEKKKKFLAGGPDNFIIISDFDRTISKSGFTEADGSVSVGQTAYSLLSSSKVMSEKFKTGMKELHAKYFPLEFDPNIDFEQKYKLMEEWWAGSNGVLIDEHTTLEKLSESVQHAKLQLRPGFATTVQLAYQHDIPVIVFSAGIEQIIHEILRKLGPTDLLLPNVKVIANELIMDEANVVTSFKLPIIHSLNKKDTSIALVRDLTQDWFKPLRQRSNVLLLGDNLGDSQMSEGYEESDDPNATTILKIGFLNDNIDKLLHQYSKAFDIVVLHDGPMVPVASFVREIIGDLPSCHEDYSHIDE